MIKISKELLNEVLENDIDFKDCDSFKVVEVVEPSILISYCYPYYDNYSTDGICDCSFKKAETYINIYELAHKCKEWANKQGYKKVYSGIYESTDQGLLYICIIDSKEGKYNLDFWADTEVEAIIKACEWILKEIKC